MNKIKLICKNGHKRVKKGVTCPICAKATSAKYRAKEVVPDSRKRDGENYFEDLAL